MSIENVEEATEQLNRFFEFLEERYHVTIRVKGGAYGSANLVIRDKETNEEIEVM